MSTTVNLHINYPSRFVTHITPTPFFPHVITPSRQFGSKQKAQIENRVFWVITQRVVAIL